MIRIDAMWLAAEPIDMRAGFDRLLSRVVQVFGAAQAHHGYLFANARGKHYVASTQGRLTLHFLPGDAPDLNPDELVWSHAKRTGVARNPCSGARS